MPVENPRRAAAAAALVAPALVALTLALASPSARAEIFGNTYRSADFGVEITVPRGFELSEQRAYPGLLARAFEHTTGARLSLAAQRLAVGENARGYVERNVRSLRKLGYKINGTTAGGSGATIVDAVSPDGKRALRQAYVVQDALAYVLTLSVAPDSMRYYGRAFDETLHSMSVTPPAAPATAPATAPASAPASQPAPPAENTP